jgi:MFS family permease
MKWDRILSRIWPQLVLTVIGTISGLAFQLNWWAAKGWFNAFESSSVLVTLVRVALVATAALFVLRMTMRWAVQRLPLPSCIKSNYQRYDTLTYSVFLLFLAGAAGIRLSIPFVYILGFAFLGAQSLLVFLILRSTEEGERFFLSRGWLSFLFLISGVAALIYQIVWQRVLFAAYGVNIESVTVIVSIFMFGLGVGSLVGGILAKRLPSHLPQLFVLCEVAIGCFGIISLPLIKWVTEVSVHWSPLSISLVTYALLGVPTIFMGATLPILVSYLHSFYQHIGKSVGILYFVNTIGSAIAALVTVDVLFVFLGQQSTVFIAAIFNFLVGILVFTYCRKLSHQQAKAEVASEPASDLRQEKKAYAISYPLALLFAAASGYISLSQEIIWVRAISYASGGMPHVFGHILGFFLFGVAGGALLGKKVCDENNIRPLTFVAWIFLATALVYYVSIPLILLC